MSLVPYWFLAALRIGLTLIPQIGYIHPDEYFQSVEVFSGDIYNTATTRPWEFNATFPIRSIALPYLVVGLPLLLLKNIAPFISLWFGVNMITPYSMLVLPRLSSCLLSFVTDTCLYKICRIYSQNYRSRLLTLASSYVLLVYGTRTFSNSIEMALCSLLIYLVAESMVRSDRILYQDEYLQECYNSSSNIRDRVKFHRLRLSLPWHTFSNAAAIATVTSLGVFNRPTFLAFAFPALFFWLQRGLGTKRISLWDFNMRILVLALCSVPTVASLVAVDSFYYGYLTWDELIQRRVTLGNNFVVTPYNFIRYNMNSANLAKHGLHPRFTHILVNVPLLYNVLGFAGLIAFLHIVFRLIFNKNWSALPRVQSVIGLMTACFIVPIGLLSVFPHQEPRFIIPCTLPLVFLHSQRIRHCTEHKNIVEKHDLNGFKVFLKKDIEMNTKDRLLAVWYIVNIVCTLFYGFVHQAGIYPLMEHLSEEMAAKPRLTTIHMITSHIYPLPTSLLRLDYSQTYTEFLDNTPGSRYRRARDFFTQEMGSSVTMGTVAINMKKLADLCESQWKQKRLKYRLYAALPSSMADELHVEALRLNLTMELIKVFYPHVSTEAPPRFLGFPSSSAESGEEEPLLNDNIFQRYVRIPLKYFSVVSHQLGLSLFRVTQF
ncbi:hypothetical protein AAG570_002361 [Ranatra chinensis]|uniref:Mannosyltransferase n=1 Tax=Ranatra chinensis TaxID=642074 RepID=A0ABD0Y7B9_9HEMI